MTSGGPGLDRRRMLAGLGIAGLGSTALAGCATPAGRGPGRMAAATPYDPVPPLAPVRAHADRLFDITVCLRPFRAAGPRLDTEMLGDTLVAHNYGHGGSGWSLSWGSGTIAVAKAMARSPREVAVIGCGALGLTSAILAQRAGAAVTIYARDLLPQARSARATGAWTPDSRIALTKDAGPQFGALWETMARTSFKTYRQYLGLPGTPVEWIDHYNVFDSDPRAEGEGDTALDTLGFAHYADRIVDLTPAPERLPPGATPFDAPYVSRGSTLMFNVADYGHTLMSDFFAAGGRFQRAEFHSPADLTALKEKVVINCPGYGARALWNDDSLTPVRGQIGWLIPQPELTYGVFYRDVNVLPRRDGIVVQALEGGDVKGFGDSNETPDRAESERAVAAIAELYGRRFRTRSQTSDYSIGAHRRPP
ncbi:MAG: dependent oxidoreductase [Caulobacteraceae bacterium]|nr:dependent oxidoreductase [Caulobacteraceae bacterium]